MWISKIRIWIWSEESTPSVDFMDSWSVFGFAQKTQNTFLDSEIHIWIFPKKRTLRVDIQIKSFYLSVHVVVELSSNIMRGNWGFRWWPKNALLWQITSNQNLVGMDQAVDTLRNTVSIPEGHVWSLAWAWFKSSNCPQMRLFTLHKNIHLRSFTCGRTLSKSKGVLSGARQPEVRRIFFNMLWRCQVCTCTQLTLQQEERVVKLHSEWVWLWHGALGLKYLCSDMG